MSSKRIFEFGEFTLDATDRLLYRSGEALRIPPKLLDTLVLLIERRGSVVTKDEIMQSVWPDTVVEEGGLARNISLLRKSLGEEDGGRYIETIPKRGYRFVGELIERGVETTMERQAPLPVQSLKLGKKIAIVAAGLVLVLLAVAFVLRHRPATKFRETALTTNSADLPVISAAISPDGQYLVYADSSGLYVRPMGAKETHPIATPVGALANYLQWFPDNVHLLVSGFDENAQKSAVWTVSILGGETQQLLIGAMAATVSPDGSQIAFLRGYHQLWLAQPDGGSPRIFAALPDNEAFATRVQFSPDGKYLLNVHTFFDSSRAILESRRLQDGQVKTLVDRDREITDMILLENGELWFSQEFAANNVSTRLFKLNLDLTTGTTGPEQVIAEWPAVWTYWFSATNDSKRIVMVKDHSQSDVYVADLAPSGIALTNARRLTLDDSKDRPSAWLPDNRTVLFHSDRERVGSLEIYRQSIDQPRAETVVSDARNNFWPQVSPDHKWILYFSTSGSLDSTGSPVDIMRRPIGGGPSVVVDTSSQLLHLRCPQQGVVCVLLEKKEEQEIFYEFDPISGRGKELARMEWSPLGIFDWDVSPDGHRIAAVVPTNTRNTIAVFSLKNGAATRSDFPVVGYQAIRSLFWDTKGEGFYVSSVDQFAGVLLHVSLDGKTHVLHRMINNAEGWAIPSPDGKHLAFQEWTLGGNVWMLER